MSTIARLVAPGGLFCLGAMAFLGAGKVELLGFDPLDAAFFPQMIASAIMFLAIAEVVSVFRNSAFGTAVQSDINIREIAKAAICYLAFVGLCLSSYFSWLAFPFSGIAFFLICGVVYMEKFTPVRLAVLCGMAVAFSATLDLIFRSAFYVSMP